MSSEAPTGSPTTEFQEPGGEHPHVVMIVANDVAVDARVRKVAQTVAAMGAKVTVLGISTATSETPDLKGVEVRLLPVADFLRRSQGTRAIRLGRPSDSSLRTAIQAEREWFQYVQRDIGSRIGWLRKRYFEGRSRRLIWISQLRTARKSRLRALTSRYSAQSPITRTYNRWQSVHIRAINLVAREQVAVERFRERRFRRIEARLQRRLERALEASTNRISRWTNKLADRSCWLARPSWRHALPELHDFDRAFGPVLDALDPDIIHAHDVHLLGVASRSIGRAYIRGRTPRLIYDAHEYVRGLATYSRYTLGALIDLESEYISCADRVVTVSPGLATLLERDYRLPIRPSVVMNTPRATAQGQMTVREAAGVPQSELLVVYSGGLDPTRGIQTLVEAMKRFSPAHLVLVTRAESAYSRDLQRLALENGWANRLHFLPFVEPDAVVRFLSSADIAVHPMVSGPLNHEIALPNKLFDYLQARLPLVVSDCEAMMHTVKTLGVGESFPSGNADLLLRALHHVADNLTSYRRRYLEIEDRLAEFTWETQAEELRLVYKSLWSTATSS